MDRSGESMNPKDKHADWLLKPTANKLADIQAFKTEELTIWERNTTATMLRQQQAEIEALKELNTMLKDAIEKRIEMDANRYRFIQNFAEEQHQRAVALEMRELTDEEIKFIAYPFESVYTTYDKQTDTDTVHTRFDQLGFARAILKKAQE